MTKEDFTKELKKLQECFPKVFDSAIRNSLIAQNVSEFEHRWWQQLVERMILSNNPKLDIADAARAERQARRSQRNAQDVAKATEVVKQQMTSHGLADALKAFGAHSLLEAIEFKKGK